MVKVEAKKDKPSTSPAPIKATTAATKVSKPATLAKPTIREPEHSMSPNQMAQAQLIKEASYKILKKPEPAEDTAAQSPSKIALNSAPMPPAQSLGSNIAQIKLGGQSGFGSMSGGAGLFSGPNPFQNLNS